MVTGRNSCSECVSSEGLEEVAFFRQRRPGLWRVRGFLLLSHFLDELACCLGGFQLVQQQVSDIHTLDGPISVIQAAHNHRHMRFRGNLGEGRSQRLEDVRNRSLTG